MHMDVDTKRETTFKKAVQQTAPLDAIVPNMRRDPDSMTQQQTHNKESEAYEVACQMDTRIKTHMKEVKNADTESVDTDLDNPQKTYVTDRRGTTDDAENARRYHLPAGHVRDLPRGGHQQALPGENCRV
jgi:hypothetical protein